MKKVSAMKLNILFVIAPMIVRMTAETTWLLNRSFITDIIAFLLLI